MAKRLTNEDLTRKNKKCSKAAPGEVGNTETSPDPLKSSKKVWSITVFPPFWNLGSVKPVVDHWITLHCSEAVWQVERGEETGRLHLQMTIRLKVKNRLSWIRNHMFESLHAGVTNNIDASFDYCKKTETRVEGPWKYPEPMCNFVEDPLKDKVLYYWQQKLEDIVCGPVHPRKIYWFWERTGGVGKTDYTKHLMLKYGACMFQGAKKDIAYAYKGQKICVFLFTRSVEHISYDALESVKDGLIFSPKYESGCKLYNQPHVICFSNWTPNTSMLSADRWVIEEILPAGAGSLSATLEECC